MLEIDLPKCVKNQHQFRVCLQEIFEVMMKRFANAGEDYRWVPRLEPLILNNTRFLYESGSIGGQLSLRRPSVHGLSAVKFENVSFVQSKQDLLKIQFQTFLPTVRVEGSYRADLRYNNLYLEAKGKFDANLQQMHLDQVTEAFIFKKDNMNFLKFSDLQIQTDLKDVNLEATGIFPDIRLSKPNS